MKTYYFGFIVLAAILDIGANLLLKKSDGFRHWRYGAPALVMICLAFTCLAQATIVYDLAVAYVTWGAMAILGTVISARFLFNQRINRIGWLGIAMILASIVLLKST